MGSLFVGPFDFADFLILPAALLLDRLTRREGRARDVLLLALIGAALLASQTRANVIALAIMALLALSPGPQRVFAHRLRLVAIVVLGGLALVAVLTSLYVIFLLEILKIRHLQALGLMRRKDPGEMPQSERAA